MSVETSPKPTSWHDWLLATAPETRGQARLSRWYVNWLALKRNPLAVSGVVVVLALILMAIFAQWLTWQSPYDQMLTARLRPPSSEHWFGTDELGRDIFTRILYGSRITLLIIFLVSVIVLPVGLVIGTVAGYFGGILDTALMRITDIFLALPRLVMALAFAAALGPGIENAVVAISITAWPPYARLARAETMTVRRSDFILATKMQGASALRIIWSHIVPLCLPSVIVRLTLDMAGIILIAAGLGFLGLGAQPPAPEWGLMVSSGRGYLLDQWWVATIPGLAIFVVSFGFNLLGDGLRDVFDPKSQ
jgi:peptide/nickel transport system permease protein